MCVTRVHLAPGWNAAAGQSATRVCPLPATEWHGGDPALIQAECIYACACLHVHMHVRVRVHVHVRVRVHVRAPAR